MDKKKAPREFFAFHLNMRDYYSDFLVNNGKSKAKIYKVQPEVSDSSNIKEVLDERVPMTDKILPGDNTLTFGRKVIMPSSFVGSPRWFNA